MRKKFVVGKCDYEGKGKSNEVDIEYSLENGRFSASGNIWLKSKKDIMSGGQNLDEILSLFPDNETVQRIVKVWKEWHLNDMKAGSPKQMEFLSNVEISGGDYYSIAKEKLAEAGLDPDESYQYN